jgi:hypothetical protein
MAGKIPPISPELVVVNDHRFNDAATSSEQVLVKLYMELTGGTESSARSVFMHLCCKEREEFGSQQEAAVTPFAGEEPRSAKLLSKMSTRHGALNRRFAVPVPA